MKIAPPKFSCCLWVVFFSMTLTHGPLCGQTTEEREAQEKLIMTEQRLRAAEANEVTLFDRSGYRRVVHIYGDSISRGFGFVEFEDPSPLSRIQDIAGLLARENGVPQSELAIRYAWSQDPRRLENEIRAGTVRPEDVVLYQDAGPHENNAGQRRTRLQDFINAVRLTDPRVELILTTTFDFDPPPVFENSRYDEPVAGSTLSMNAVLLEVAVRENVPVLDWNLQIDAAVAALAPSEIFLMHNDGVHPNALGNFALAISILQHLGIEIRSWNSVVNEFVQLDKEHVKVLRLMPPLKRLEVERLLAAIVKQVQGSGRSAKP